MTRLSRVIVSAACAAVCVSCGTTAAAKSPALVVATTSSVHESTQGVDVAPVVGDGGSRVRTYNSIEDLASQSTAIVVARGTGKVVTQRIEGVDFQVVEFSVERILAGKVDGAIKVHLFAMDTKTRKMFGASGETLLLFLRPFVLQAGVETGEWVATDPLAGVYLQLDDKLFYRVDPDSALLPEKIDVGTLRVPTNLKSYAEVVAHPFDYR